MKRSTYSAVLTVLAWAVLPWVGLSLVDGMGRSMSAQTSKREPLTIEGKLNESSQVLDDGSSVNRHTFEGRAGEVIAIELVSEQFDAYVMLNDPQEQRIDDDDDSGRGKNALIVVTLPANGTYTVLANSYGEAETGEYRLIVRSVTAADQTAIEAERLFQQGNQQYRSSQFREALTSYQAALPLYRQIGYRLEEGTTLNSIGAVYHSLGRYEEALQQFQLALAIRREVGDRPGEGVTLNNIGEVYRSQGRYEEALQQYQQALVIRREVGDRRGEGTTLHNIGSVYQSIGRYEEALQYYQQDLAITREVSDRPGEGVTLNNIGLVYKSLGRYEEALQQYQLALAIIREVGNRPGEGTILNNIGSVYDSLGRYEEALQQFQLALAISREVGDRAGEGTTLNNIGGVYDSLGRYEEALQQYQQSLAIRREVGDRSGEGATLNNIGNVYQSLGRYEEALQQFQLALAIHREVGDREGEGITLNNIGYVLESQKQTELAIVFLKQSVNEFEKIRNGIRGLSIEEQQSYTDTIANTYRKLADLLLQQNRILEAQRVLDLLKVQELNDYLQNVRGNAQTETGVEYWQPEQRILDLYAQVIGEGVELLQLEEKERTGGLTPAEEQAYQAMLARRQEILTSFSRFSDDPIVQEALEQLRQSTEGQNIELANFNRLQRNLQDLQQDAVLLYPLILEDRLELVLVTPYSPPIRRPVAVKPDDLNRAIVTLGQALKDPAVDAKPAAQQLYQWLIAPIEAELQAAQARTIIYAPDGALRYIPLAALHDGQAWLTQRFAFSQITAASLIDFSSRPSADLRVLAAACAACRFDFEVGGQPFSFDDLPYTKQEVENLAATIPGTATRLDLDFHPADLLNNLRRYSVIHLATHAAFVQSQGDESFIVFGNGDRVSLAQIREQWDLTNVDLIVLSACETALGETELGSGVEILGFGFQMQDAGAKAAIASLWQVSDGGTQMLMDAFYAALNQGMTKAEALRQAQIALITGDLTPVGGIRGEASISIVSTATGLPINVSNNLDHPYYWAPFILIGNGL